MQHIPHQRHPQSPGQVEYVGQRVETVVVLEDDPSLRGFGQPLEAGRKPVGSGHCSPRSAADVHHHDGLGRLAHPVEQACLHL